jgi:hypothetical protein
MALVEVLGGFVEGVAEGGVGEGLAEAAENGAEGAFDTDL